MQTKAKKIAQLIRNFPILGFIQYDWRWIKNKHWRQPNMEARVQVADPDTMHLRGNNIPFNGRSYLMGKNETRGTRKEYLLAVDGNDKVIATMETWIDKGEEKVVKDAFKLVSPDVVAYLIWVTGITWHEAPTKEMEKKDRVFGKKVAGVDVEAIIFRKPKGKTFEDLIHEADRRKQERENAYKFPPKDTPPFPSVHKALQEGYKLHAFRSGGGLRVVRLDRGSDACRGYGEHPNVEEALNFLEEDTLAGGRPYGTVYGKLHPHYLTGSNTASSNLDAWLLRGHTFDCWQEDEEVVFQLNGHVRTETPPDVEKRIAELEFGEGALWKNRGFTYFTEKTKGFRGGVAFTTRVVDSPDEKRDAWMYRVTKTGCGKDIWEAMKNAFAADEKESA